MGIDLSLYCGPYMKIWMPDVEVNYTVHTCINRDCSQHGLNRSQNSFCSHCGSPIKDISLSKSKKLNLGEFLEKEFNDVDMFVSVYPSNVDYVIAVPNRTYKQGGFYFEDSDKTEILIFSNFEKFSQELENFNLDFEKEDWIKLQKALRAKNIKYERFTGILKWWS